jgi:hypothetical protein
MPQIIGLTHEMHDSLTFLEIEIKIDLRTAIMQMRRACVPNTAVLHCSKAEKQLRGFAHCGNDVLIDRSLVRIFR